MTLKQIKQKILIRELEKMLGLRDPFYITAAKKLLARSDEKVRKAPTEEELEAARMRLFEELSSEDVKLMLLSWGSF